MERQNIRQWLDLVLHCLGSDHSVPVSITDDELDELFVLNFNSLYRPKIVSNVGWLVAGEPDKFYAQFDAFKADVRANFNSSDGAELKRQHADWIRIRLDTIRTAANRLAQTLTIEWNRTNDVRRDDSFSRSEIIFLINDIRKEFDLNGLINTVKTDSDRIKAKSNLAELNKNREPDQRYFYAALWLADRTERYLFDWLEMYCSSGYSKPGVKQTAVIKSVEQYSQKQRQPRPSTLAREKRLCTLVMDFMRVEGVIQEEAMRLAAQKEGCGIDTVERALGFRSR